MSYTSVIVLYINIHLILVTILNFYPELNEKFNQMYMCVPGHFILHYTVNYFL